MAKPDIWMPLYVAKYLADTLNLTTEQHGAYMLLLMASWMGGGQLPNDDEQLASICKLDRKTWGKYRPILEKFFNVTADAWAQKRLTEEYEKAQKISAKNSENGKKGGRPRNPEITQTETQSITQTKPTGKAEQKPNETPLPLPLPTSNSKASSGKPDLPPGFIRFWTAWPKTERKQGRAQCFDIWKRKSLEADADQIVAHVEKMKLSESWRTGFDPMPETYLNGRRWDGAELDAPTNGKPSAPVMLCEFRGEHFNLQLDPCGMAPAQKGSIYGGRALCVHHKRQIDDRFEEKTPMPDDVRIALAGLVRKVAA